MNTCDDSFKWCRFANVTKLTSRPEVTLRFQIHFLSGITIVICTTCLLIRAVLVLLTIPFFIIVPIPFPQWLLSV